MSLPRIRFTLHALFKFEILRAHGLQIDQDTVLEIVRHPGRVDRGYGGRWVAQGPLDGERVLRVVCEEEQGETVIVTFYPGRRSRYEEDTI